MIGGCGVPGHVQLRAQMKKDKFLCGGRKDVYSPVPSVISGMPPAPCDLPLATDPLRFVSDVCGLFTIGRCLVRQQGSVTA